MNIELNDQEVQNLIQILTNSTGMPWVMTHPLIIKISAQQQEAQAAMQRLQQLQPTLQHPQEQKGNSHGTATGDLDTKRSAAGSVGSAGRGADSARS